MTIQFLKSVRKAALLSGLILSISSPVLGLEIRQEIYQYSPVAIPVTIPAAQNFIITPTPSLRYAPETRPFPVVHFSLNESRVSSDEASRLLNELRGCGFAGPLQLSGYTCSIGKEMQNKTLSQKRADSVSGLLKANGYFVVFALGRGALSGADLEGNRRVDIKPAVHMHNIVQPKIKTGGKK